jgi:hypothetical protein
MTDTTVYPRIVAFVSALADMYAGEDREIAKYNRLLERTNPEEHTNSVAQHVTAFREFIANNENSLRNQRTPFDQPLIAYSENVHLDMNQVFREAAENDHPTIWKHLLVLWAFLDRDSDARAVLQSYRDHLEEQKTMNDPLAGIDTESAEGQMLANVIGAAANASNPQEMMGSIMNPSFISSMLNSVTSGQLDPKKLVGMTMGLLENVQTHMPSDERERVEEQMAMTRQMSQAMMRMSGSGEAEIPRDIETGDGGIEESKD